MEIDLLTLSQIQGKAELEIFKKYGINAKVTDYVILLGRDDKDDFFRRPYGSYITKSYTFSSKLYDSLHCVCRNGNIYETNLNTPTMCIRPSLKYSLIAQNLIKNRKIQNDILEIEYGEYPQNAVDEELNNTLEYLFLKNKLEETGKEYTVNHYPMCSDTIFFTEYKFNNKKYVRLEGDHTNESDHLLDGRMIFEGFYYWVEVEPITWLVDKKNDIAITKDLLVSHIFFNNCIAKFKDTKMYKYLNDNFLDEIQIKPKEIKIEVIKEKSKQEIELENIEKTKQKILALKNKIK